MAQKSYKIYDKVLDLFPQFGWKKISDIPNENPASLFAYLDKKTGKVVHAIVPKVANCKKTVLSTLGIALSKVFSKVRLGDMLTSLDDINEQKLDAIAAYATGKPTAPKEKVNQIINKSIKTTQNGKENPTI